MSDDTMPRGKAPWAGLGIDVDPKLKPIDMMKAAGLDWKVQKSPIFHSVVENGVQTYKQVERRYALTRSSDNHMLTVVGEAYKPIQNEEAINFLMEFIKAGSMKLETMGSLRGGSHIWGLAKIGYNFNLSQDELVEGYLLISIPHMLGHGITVKHMSVRNVGMTTITQPIRENGRPFRMPHLRAFDEKTRVIAEKALRISKEMSEDFEDDAKLLASKPITREEFRKYVMQIMDPKKRSTVLIQDASRPARLVYSAIDSQPGADLESSNMTWWGALNAVLYVIDHQLGRDADGRLHNAWFGGRSVAKTRALDIALERCGKV